jgi:hypothetical protein
VWRLPPSVGHRTLRAPCRCGPAGSNVGRIGNTVRALALILVIGLHGCAVQPRAALDSDAPEPRQARTSRLDHPATYAQALQSWSAPEEVNAWIAENFEYDLERALRLSESQRLVKGTPPIHAPPEFFANPRGVCVDLARFAVETLRSIAPQSNARYFMLEFDPVGIEGHLLRRHWLVSFERDGKLYFFADSKRPGSMAGPYTGTQEFVDEYAQYRGRQITAFLELPSYQRRAKAKAARQVRDGA